LLTTGTVFSESRKNGGSNFPTPTGFEFLNRTRPLRLCSWPIGPYQNRTRKIREGLEQFYEAKKLDPATLMLRDQSWFGLN
jgi:hypothetical protein